MTVGEMLQRMSSDEISEWRVYFQILEAERAQTSSGSGSSTMFRGQALPE